MLARFWRLSAALAVCLSFAGYAVAQDEGREFHWKGKLAPDQVVEIKNINGRIDAQTASGDEVEVSAEKIGPDAEQVRIEVIPSSQGVTICAVYPSDFGGSGGCEPGGHWRGDNVHGDRTKVNFSVHLPSNLRFAARNVNGSVTAEDLGRSVQATSVNGSVRVSSKSWVEASSVNGSVDVTMGSADWSGSLKLSSVNGSVEVTLPSDFNADVRFKTVNGRIDSDFPVTVRGGLGGHTVDGRIGSGGRELELQTVNGSIRVHHGTI